MNNPTQNQERYDKRFQNLENLINEKFPNGEVDSKPQNGYIELSRQKRLIHERNEEKNPRVCFYPSEEFMDDLEIDFEGVCDQAGKIANEVLENPPFKNRHYQGTIHLNQDGAIFKERRLR